MIDTEITGKKMAQLVKQCSSSRLTVNGVAAVGSSEIKFKQMRFLITDSPSNATLDRYIEVLNKNKVKHVVRVCEPTYDVNRLQRAGIKVTYWPNYEDGQVPSQEVLKEWLDLVRARLAENPDESCIAVHCAAGLGRAPLLVAIALMELGMKFEEAVELIRMKRRGALNKNQMDFLEHYRAKSRLNLNKRVEAGCSIM